MLLSLDLMSAECWIDRWSNWFLGDNIWWIWWWFCMSCFSPIIFGHYLNWLYRYTICKLIISFPSSRIRCCNPMNLKNCFLLLRKGRLLLTISYDEQFFKCTYSNFPKDVVYTLRLCFFIVFYEVQLWHFLYVCVSRVWMSIWTRSNVIWYFMIFHCSPWIEYPYKDAVERNAFGGLSLDAFLSEVHKSFITQF